jgi:plasmid maintenance system killer protein
MDKGKGYVLDGYACLKNSSSRYDLADGLALSAALPGNRFETLAGDRKGQYSIRINDQWRICFQWADRAPGPSNVEIVAII